MLREYAGRFTVCIGGLLMCALSVFFGVKAGVAGTNGWNTLAIGLALVSEWSVGRCTLLISLTIIAIDILLKGKFGFGTLLNIFLVSLFTDVYLAVLSFIPDATTQLGGALYSLICQILMAFSIVIYMRPGLGAGPRDTLMVIVGNRFPHAPIGAIRFGLEMAAMAVGLALGASFGFGTVLAVALQASLLEFACRICRFEPRAVVHENIPDTLRRIAAARR